MIYSMTGYGRAEENRDNKQFIIEVKSLNGKQFELNNRFNPLLKPFEAEIRSDLMHILKRGSIDLSVTIIQDGVSKPMVVNTDLAKYYLNAIQMIAKDVQWDIEDHRGHILAALMRMPEVVSPEAGNLEEDKWLAIKSLINKAALYLSDHRKEEGEGLRKELTFRINNIMLLLKDVEQFELARVERIRNKLLKNLEEWLDKSKIDENRLEQELLFYMEKLDFTEEKQRLGTHCNYFLQLIEKGNQEGVGKKLGFVLQEIGREINTLGSKANDADIQKIVVNMKDELEKAKEQSLNVL